MEFELKPDNRGMTDNELLEDIKAVARSLGKDYVTREEYNKFGRLCSATFQKRFGTWGKAHDLAGLKRVRNFQATKEDCVADLRRVADLLETDSISTKVYGNYGKFSIPLITKRTGSWKLALEAAGLRPSPNYRERASNEELFKNLEDLWINLGRQPSKKDFVKPFSQYSYDPYPRRFGSYRKALEAFVDYIQNDDCLKSESEEASSVVESISLEPVYHHTTKRHISERLKVRVLIRDGNKCRLCGKIVTGDDIHFDHIKPWAKGGETTFENIQVLCAKHNLAKGDHYDGT